MTVSNAYKKVFGTAVEANQTYGEKIDHPVTGQKVYDKQIRHGKTAKNRKAD